MHFIQNAITVESLSKLSLRKSDRFLIRRQPNFHLLNENSEPSSSNNLDPSAYQTSNDLGIESDDLPNYSKKLLDEIYFRTKDKASQQKSPQTGIMVNTNVSNLSSVQGL